MDKTKNKEIGFLFDLDGVLIDSEREYTRIWKEIDDIYPSGVDNFPLVIKGRTLRSILSKFYPDPEVASKVTAMLDDKEKRMSYSFLPGTLDLLAEAKMKGISRILVTSSNNKKMESLRRCHPGFDNLFTGIITANDITKSKPDPEAYLLGAAKTGLPPEKCIVFEDSLQGLQAGRKAGAFIIGVRGTIPEDDLTKNADFVVDNLSQLSVDSIINLSSNK